MMAERRSHTREATTTAVVSRGIIRSRRNRIPPPAIPTLTRGDPLTTTVVKGPEAADILAADRIITVLGIRVGTDDTRGDENLYI